MKCSRARVGNFAGGQLNLKKTLTLNRQIERIARLIEIALLLDDFRSSSPRTESDLQTGGINCLLRRRRAWRDKTLVQQILKLKPPAPEARSTRVREVVGDVVKVQLLRFHSACRGVHCTVHIVLSPE